MKFKLQNLIDMKHFQSLQDRLNEIYSFPSAIIDNEGNILTATGWQDICIQFHRKNKDCERHCIQSDQYILSHLHEANPAVSYRCPQGLVDNATPIIIDGIHYGNFFTGQFFLEKPDIEFFRAQAKMYGFDEDAYIEAVKKVPIWTQEQLNSYLFFIKGLIAIISESGLKKIKEIETRKQIEKGQERHQIILQTAMDGFWMTDMQGRLLEVNEAYCRMSGYSAQELLAMSISDLEAVETNNVTAEHIHKVRAQGEERFESLHRRKDGSIFDVEVIAQYQHKDDGWIVAFLRDITDRKRAEEEIRKRDFEFNESQRVAHIGSWDWNAITDTIRWSPEYYRIYNVDPKLPTPNYLEHLKIYTSESAKRLDAAVVKTMQTGEPYELELELANPDENKRWIFAMGEAKRDTNGQIVGLRGIAQNITRRKQSEERLSKLNGCFLNFSPEPIENINRLTALCGELMGATCALYNRLDRGMLCSWGQWNTPQDYNSVDKPEGHICYDMITRCSEEVLVIHNLPETLYARTDPNVRAYNLKTYIGKAVKFCDDYVGSLCVVYQNDFSPSEDDKWLMGVIASAIAIEEKRKRTEVQIIKSLKEKEILLKEIHHRVKNNMQVISSLLGLASMNIKDEKSAEMFRDSQNRINSMALIHENLYRSKDLAKIDLNDYIGDLADSLFHSHKVAGRIELYLNIENVSLGIDLAIPCGLIINELITNSLKHAFPGDRNGEIKVSAHRNNENMIELIFSDNGVGIPSNIDFRVTQSLGLHLVTILAEGQLHGKIELNRTKGTEFKIIFEEVK